MRGRWVSPSRRSFALSVVLAVVALMLLRAHDLAVAGSGADPGRAQAVLVAARPVPRGAALTPGDVRPSSLPARFAPPGAIHELSQAAGRILLADLAPGEVVTRTRLARVRAGPVASLIPPGYRAFAVPVTLPAGSLAPGDRVDVLATSGTAVGGSPQTLVVADAVQVLALESPSPPAGVSALDASAAGAISSGTVFVLVRPDQETALAQALAVANLEVVIVPAG